MEIAIRSGLKHVLSLVLALENSSLESGRRKDLSYLFFFCFFLYFTMYCSEIQGSCGFSEKPMLWKVIWMSAPVGRALNTLSLERTWPKGWSEPLFKNKNNRRLTPWNIIFAQLVPELVTGINSCFLWLSHYCITFVFTHKAILLITSNHDLKLFF